MSSLLRTLLSKVSTLVVQDFTKPVMIVCVNLFSIFMSLSLTDTNNGVVKGGVIAQRQQQRAQTKEVVVVQHDT